MTPRDARAEAVAWLVGRLRFEQLLQDLQRDDADVAEDRPVATPKAA
jgi:hypothetical protein